MVSDGQPDKRMQEWSPVQTSSSTLNLVWTTRSPRVSAFFSSGFARRWDWQTMRKHYGGNLLNTAPHALDQALQLFGTDARPKVTCAMDRANSFGDAEDHGSNRDP